MQEEQRLSGYIKDRIMASRYERRLLYKGTGSGSVTPGTIAWDKQKYTEVCTKLNYKEEKDGWGDWIQEARREFLEYK